MESQIRAGRPGQYAKHEASAAPGAGLSPEAVARLAVLNGKHAVPCTYPWIRMTEKDVNGEYTFCPWINGSIGMAGKGETSRLAELWNSAEAVAMRRAVLDESPAGCLAGCKVGNQDLDAFLGYDEEEYASFEPAFLDNLMCTVEAVEGRNAEVASKPLALSLFPTNVCNIRCRMCKMEKRYEGEIDTAYFEGIKPLLPTLHELFVAGGEPYFCKTSRAIIFSDEVRRHRHLYVSTITNGTVLTEEVLDRLTDLRLGRFIVSLDGVTPEVYNAIRRGADFAKVRANLDRFLSFRDSGLIKARITGANFVIQALNYRQLERYVEFCHERGIRASANLIHGSAELYPCLDDVELHLHRALRRAERLGMDYTRRSLERVLERLPGYRGRVRVLSILGGLIGEDNLQRAQGFLDRHEGFKQVLKRMLAT